MKTFLPKSAAETYPISLTLISQLFVTNSVTVYVCSVLETILNCNNNKFYKMDGVIFSHFSMGERDCVNYLQQIITYTYTIDSVKAWQINLPSMKFWGVHLNK